MFKKSCVLKNVCIQKAQVFEKTWVLRKKHHLQGRTTGTRLARRHVGRGPSVVRLMPGWPGGMSGVPPRGHRTTVRPWCGLDNSETWISRKTRNSTKKHGLLHKRRISRKKHWMLEKKHGFPGITQLSRKKHRIDRKNTHSWKTTDF